MALSGAVEGIGHARAAPKAGWRAWLHWFLPLLAILLAWGLGTPIGGSPDEYDHVNRAAAAGRGQLTGPERLTGVGYVMELQLPTSYTQHFENACWLGSPTMTPSCEPPVDPDPTLRATSNIVGRYPPLFYLVMALPARQLSQVSAVYVMRVMNALLCAAFLAAALVAAQGVGRGAVFGVGAAITPMVLYLGGVVNPSGLELASAVALWSSSMALARARHVDRRLVVLAAVSFTVFANSRGLSLPMAAVALAAPLTLAHRAVLADVVRDRAVRPAIGLLAAAVVAAVAWGLLRGRGRAIPGYDPSFTVAAGLRRSWRSFQESVAWFGQFEVRVLVAIAIWFVIWLVIAVAALRAASVRERLVLVATFLAALLVPVVVSVVLKPPPIYTDWQGRHGLPLWIGVPIVGGAILSRGNASRRHAASTLSTTFVAAGAVMLAIGHMISFVVAAHRYSVGSKGPLVYLLDPLWGDPVRHWASLILAAAGCLGLAWQLLSAHGAVINLLLPSNMLRHRARHAEGAPGDHSTKQASH